MLTRTTLSADRRHVDGWGAGAGSKGQTVTVTLKNADRRRDGAGAGCIAGSQWKKVGTAARCFSGTCNGFGDARAKRYNTCRFRQRRTSRPNSSPHPAEKRPPTGEVLLQIRRTHGRRPNVSPWRESKERDTSVKSETYTTSYEDSWHSWGDICWK